VSTIIRLADDPNASQRDLERAFEKDPAIAAKILKVANSAYYGGAHVPSIGRALSFLGTSAVRSLVVGVAFHQMTAGKSLSKQFDKLEYWRHSLATAVICRILGKIRSPGRAEELYVAGMMHDLGQLIMERFMPAELDECIQNSRMMGLPLHVVEQEVIGFNHAQVGGILAKRWGLSALVQAGVSFHHDPDGDGDFYDTTILVAAANAMAHEAGFMNGQRQGVESLSYPMVEAMSLPLEQLDVIRQVASQEVTKASEAFHIAA
jgi:HD-like signal output (HDOD) protein